jgi:hypothetical protein
MGHRTCRDEVLGKVIYSAVQFNPGKVQFSRVTVKGKPPHRQTPQSSTGHNSASNKSASNLHPLYAQSKSKDSWYDTKRPDGIGRLFECETKRAIISQGMFRESGVAVEIVLPYVLDLRVPGSNYKLLVKDTICKHIDFRCHAISYLCDVGTLHENIRILVSERARTFDFAASSVTAVFSQRPDLPGHYWKGVDLVDDRQQHPFSRIEQNTQTHPLIMRKRIKDYSIRQFPSPIT